MKSGFVGVILVLALGSLLHPSPATAYTEEEMRGAEAVLDRQVEQKRAAEANARPPAATGVAVKPKPPKARPKLKPTATRNGQDPLQSGHGVASKTPPVKGKEYIDRWLQP